MPATVAYRSGVLITSLVAFTFAAALLTITPGLDTALVLRTSIVDGPTNGMRAGLGIALGCFIWGALAALGLGALVAASELAYDVVRWVGSAYLVYLGLKLILAPGATFALGGSETADLRKSRRGHRHFARGIFTNLLNPKVGVFYVSFLPQFVPPHANVVTLTLAMTTIHAVLGLIWFALLCTATRPLSRILQRPRIVRSLDRITGGVFIAFGAKLALERR